MPYVFLFRIIKKKGQLKLNFIVKFSKFKLIMAQTSMA